MALKYRPKNMHSAFFVFHYTDGALQECVKSPLVVHWKIKNSRTANRNIRLPFFFYSLAFSTVLNSNVDILVKIGDSSC